MRPSLDGVHFKCIGDDDNAALCEIYSEEEIKQEVWECDGDRLFGISK